MNNQKGCSPSWQGQLFSRAYCYGYGGHGMNNDGGSNGRSLATIIAEVKEELKQFVQTRVEILKAELGEKVKSLKLAAPLAAAALLLLGTAYLLLTLSLVALVAVAFAESSYRWFFAFAIVFAVWFILGAIAAYFAKREFEL